MKLKSEIKNFPDEPGIYFLKNEEGRVIYVGKATSLKERIRSYFAADLDAKTRRLMAEVRKIDFQKTDSPLEALFLEGSEIKKYSPKYNIKEKDDKSRIYVHITRETFPRPYLLRETDLPKLKEGKPLLYGPYLSSRSLKEALELIRKIVPHRSCNVMPKKRCLYGHLGLCEMPCEGKVGKKEYAKRIRQIRDFFEGKKSRVLSGLQREMKLASKGLNYERAAKIRDRIFALEHLKQMFVIKQERPVPLYRRIEGYDISNISGAYAVGSMVVFIDGMSEKSEYRKFRIKPSVLSLRVAPGSVCARGLSPKRDAAISPSGDVAMLKQVLSRRFHYDWPRPDLILIDGGRGQVNAAVSVLKNFNLDIPVVGLAKGPDRKKDEIITSRTLPRQEIALFKEVRDEAHRFAKGYYEKLHRKNNL